jgi:hypothetical protein
MRIRVKSPKIKKIPGLHLKRFSVGTVDFSWSGVKCTQVHNLKIYHNGQIFPFATAFKFH